MRFYKYLDHFHGICQVFSRFHAIFSLSRQILCIGKTRTDVLKRIGRVNFLTRPVISVPSRQTLYIPNQYRHFMRKTFFPSSVKLLRNRCSGRNSKSDAPTCSNAASRDWVQTRNKVLPGRNSQRRTVLPRSERRWKSWFSFNGYGLNWYDFGSTNSLKSV